MPILIANYIVNDDSTSSIIYIAILMYISNDYCEIIVLAMCCVQSSFKVRIQ